MPIAVWKHGALTIGTFREFSSYFLKNSRLSVLLTSAIQQSDSAFYILHVYIYTYCLVAKLCPTLVSLWTVACQAPLSVEFPKQEDWSGLPFIPSLGNHYLLEKRKSKLFIFFSIIVYYRILNIVLCAIW